MIKKMYKIISRLSVHNINKFQNMIKILLRCMLFDYTISNLVHELNRQNDLQTYFNIDEVPTEKQVYEFMSKVPPETINNMVNSILKPYYSKNRDAIVRYTLDETPVELGYQYRETICKTRTFG